MLQTQYEFTLPKGYMDEEGNLLPGMNVDGVITLEEANDVLTIR